VECADGATEGKARWDVFALRIVSHPRLSTMLRVSCSLDAISGGSRSGIGRNIVLLLDLIGISLGLKVGTWSISSVVVIISPEFETVRRTAFNRSCELKGTG